MVRTNAAKKPAATNGSAVNIISGKAYWASVIAPNTTFEPCWKIDITLDEENKAKVEADGLSVKNKGDERGDFITLKRNVQTREGASKEPPEVIDAQKNKWDGAMIGNGSVVNVKYKAYDYSYRGKSGRSAELLKVQVVDLIPYGDSAKDFDVVDGGYTVEKDAF